MPQIPATMRALQLLSYSGIDGLTLAEVPVPQPGPGEVLVKMYAAPANPSDLQFLDGDYNLTPPLPTIPGFEGSGTIVAAGPGLYGRLLVGRRAAVSAPQDDRANGTWAEYMVAPAMQIVPLIGPLGGGMSLEDAATLIVNPVTAYALVDLARKAGARALAQNAAAGQVGRMVLAFCQRYGLPAVHIVRRQAQVDLLRALGAEYVLDSSQPDYPAQMQALFQRLNVTYALDAIGGDSGAGMFNAMQPGGTLNVYGNLSMDPISVDPRVLFFQDKRVVNFYLPKWSEQAGFIREARLMLALTRWAGEQFTTTIQGRCTLSDAIDGLRTYAQNMTAGKILIRYDAN